MQSFSALDPYPLWPLERCFKQEAKEHARQCDAWLGFNLGPIESHIRGRRHLPELQQWETWSHLDAQIFLTSYVELRALFELLQPLPGERVVDLGCAYSRIPFILARHFPEVSFVGYECVDLRVVESQRVIRNHGLLMATVYCADLGDPTCDFLDASYYFIYDCGSHSDVEKVLDRIREKFLSLQTLRPTLIARGARVRDLIAKAHPWLGEARHSNQNFQIFRP